MCLDGSTWTALKTEATSKTVLKDVFTGDGSTQTFISANVTTAPENLIVYIDSVMQEPDLLIHNRAYLGSTHKSIIVQSERFVSIVPYENQISYLKPFRSG